MFLVFCDWYFPQMPTGWVLSIKPGYKRNNQPVSKRSPAEIRLMHCVHYFARKEIAIWEDQITWHSPTISPGQKEPRFPFSRLVVNQIRLLQVACGSSRMKMRSSFTSLRILFSEFCVAAGELDSVHIVLHLNLPVGKKSNSRILLTRIMMGTMTGTMKEKKPCHCGFTQCRRSANMDNIMLID